MRCINLPGWRAQQTSKPSRHRYARYAGYSNPPARGCQLQLLELAWPGLAWPAAVCHCLSVLARQQEPTCFWPLCMELMPNRIYITEPPFSCCVYCSCCDKCYRCPSLCLSHSLLLSLAVCRHQLQLHSSI